jgi:hypothetical protein
MLFLSSIIRADEANQLCVSSTPPMLRKDVPTPHLDHRMERTSFGAMKFEADVRLFDQLAAATNRSPTRSICVSMIFKTSALTF